MKNVGTILIAHTSKKLLKKTLKSSKEKEVGPPETGAVSMVMTGIMLVVAGIAVNMGKRRKKH